MIILEPSDNLNERVPLNKGAEIDITATTPLPPTSPPPYAPTLPPNPIPSYRATHNTYNVSVPRRRSPLRRLLGAFAVACLVLLLWGIFIDSFSKVINRPGHKNADKLVQTQDTLHIGSHHPQEDINNSSRVLPIQYPPKMTGS